MRTRGRGSSGKRPSDGDGSKTPDPKGAGKRRELSGEALEERVLLSATWADADTGEAIEGATGDADEFQGSIEADIASGGGGNDELFGNAGDDILSGDGGADTIDGGDGDDVLDGGDGDDAIDGGAGDDTIVGSSGTDTIDGGSGDDTVDYSSMGSGVDVDVTGGAGGAGAQDAGTIVNVETVIGSDHDDTFRFESPEAGATYTIDGGGGSNTIDLSGFSAADATFDHDAGTVTVGLGGGESFTIEHSGVGHFAFEPGTDLSVELADAVVVDEASEVTLGATSVASSDAEVTYRWTQTGGPSVAMSGADTGAMTFETPELDAGTVMSFRLEVSDGDSTVVETVTVGVTGDNDPVVLDLGGDQVVNENEPVTVNATAVDPEGKDFVYEWRQVSGPAVNLSGTDTLSPSFTAPELLVSEEIVLELTANDGQTTISEQVTISVQAENDAAVADAGGDSSVAENASITLRGSGVDPEGEDLTFSWRQISGPSVSLDDPSSAQPSFTAPEGVANSTVRFELTVSDGENVTTDTVAVTINADDDAPRIISAPDLSVHERDEVTLSVVAEDPEGEGLTYAWRQTGGIGVSLDGVDSASPTFTAPEQLVNSWMTFEVEVSDGESTVIETVRVLVGADNEAPTVEAIDDFTADGNGIVTLGASAEDPEGRAVAYVWSQVDGPEATIYGPGSAEPSVRLPSVDEPTTVTFQISVTDGRNTTIDTVSVLVEPDVIVVDDPGSDPGGGGSGSGGGGGGDDVGGGGGGGGGGGSPPAADPEPLLIQTPALVEGEEVSGVALSASVESSDGDVTYSWRQVAGSESVVLSGADSATPSFEAPNLVDSEIFIFELTASDGSSTVVQTVNVRIEADNDAAEVDAGPDIDATEEDTVTLGVSVDEPEGQHVTYQWTQIGGPDVELSGVETGAPSFTAPNTLEPTEYTFRVAVSDGENVSYDTVTVLVDADDDAPSVSAGADRVVTEGSAVTLNSVANDPEGQGLTYSWVQTGGPSVDLSDAAEGSPTFTAPNLLEDTDLTFELTVSDGVHEVTESVTITVEADDDPPVIDAGPLIEVDENEPVALSVSIDDPEGRDVSVSWRQIGGSGVTLEGADTANPTFTAPDNLTNSFLRFEVVVSDGTHEVVDTVRVLVNADNDAPMIDAGPDIVATERAEVSLGGSATDPEGGSLQHSWRQVSGPAVSLNGADGLSPTFTAPDVNSPTPIVFELTTTDGENTVVDTVTVTVEGSNDAAIATDATSAGYEDTTVAVRLSGTDQDYGDAVESFRIESLPAHGELRLDGVAVVPGTVVSADQIGSGSLTFEPDADWSGTATFNFSVSDGDEWSAESGEQAIRVYGRADAPVVDAGSASGDEDTFIDLTPSFATTDIDGSEAISRVTLEGMPRWSTITDGDTTIVVSTGGAVDITHLDMTSLQIRPAADHELDFEMTLSVTAREPDSGHTTTVSDTVVVEINPVDDTPRPYDTTISTNEDSPVTVSPNARQVDLTDPVEVYRIDSLPADGTLLFDGEPVEIGATFTVAQRDAGLLTYEPPHNFSGSATFEFSASDGDRWSTSSGGVTIEVHAVADEALTAAADAGGDEDTAIALDISAEVTDDSESITGVVISGVPEGASLSAGIDNGDGTWSLDAGDLDGLTITPPSNFNGSFELGYEVETTEASNGASTTTGGTLNVEVEAVNDASVAVGGSSDTAEDQAVRIDLAGTDIEDGETIAVFRVDVMPEHGTLLLDGVEISQGQEIPGDAVREGRLTFEPDADFSGDDSFSFSAGDGELWSAETAEYTLSVEAVADQAVIDSPGAAGDEDTAIPLNFSASVSDDSESITGVVVSGVPEGASLSAGIDNGDGTWSLEAGDLDGLTITPPENSSDDFELTFDVTTQEASNGDTAIVSHTLNVEVEAVNDASVAVGGSSDTAEDQAVRIDLAGTDIEDGETIAVFRVDVMPEHGTLLLDGVEISQGQEIPGDAVREGRLTFEPDADFSGDDSFSFSAGDGELWSAETAEYTLSVEAVADQAVIDSPGAAGDEDTAIPLNFSASVSDDSESITGVVVSGVPEGASLSAGIDNGDGTWSLEAGDLDGLTITPPENSSDDFELTFDVTTQEASNGDTAIVSHTLNVEVEAVNDASVAVGGSSDTAEDQAVRIDLAGTDIEDGETIAVFRVDVMPEHGTLLLDGVEISQGQEIPGDAVREGRLTFEPDADFSGDDSFSFSAGDGELWSAETAEYTLSVEAVADQAVIDSPGAAGDEDTAIPLNFSASVSDDSESITGVVVSGVPEGASLSAGIDNGDGTWSLEAGDLDGLTITPPENSSDDFELTFDVTTQEASNGDTAIVSHTLNVEVEAVADVASVHAGDVAGLEDSAIALDLSASVTDASESITGVVVSGVPEGASLSAGIDNGDGTWSLDAGDLDGLTITPPADSDADFTLGYEVITTDGVDNASAIGTFDVVVAGVSDGADVSADDVRGSEDSAISIGMAASVLDSSEEITGIVISGVPEGASLSAGVDNGDGTWTLAAGDLDGLTVTPAANSDADFTLGYEVTTADDGDVATVSGTFDVRVDAVADGARIDAEDVIGYEDTAIPLSFAPIVVDDSESISAIGLSGVPAGAAVTDGVRTIDADGSMIDVTGWDTDALSVTPPLDANGSFEITFSVTTTESSNGDSATVSETVTVQAVAVNDAPVALPTVVTTAEDQPVAVKLRGVDVKDGLVPTQFRVDTVPEHGTLMLDGQAVRVGESLPADAVRGGRLVFEPDADWAGETSFSFSAGDGELWSSATSNAAITVEARADAAQVSADARGAEDTAIELRLSASVIDESESITGVVVTGVPDGAMLSAGVDNGDGTWTLTADQLDGLTVTPPADSDADFTLGYEVTTQDGEDEFVQTGAFDVHVDAVTDGVELSVVSDVSGHREDGIPLTISVASLDADGSETVTIVVSGLPEGATLSAGSAGPGGTWVLTPDQLEGLELVVPEESGAQAVTLGVSVVSQDGRGALEQTSSSSIDVELEPSRAKLAELEGEANDDADDPDMWDGIGEMAILNARDEIEGMVELADEAAEPDITEVFDVPEDAEEPLVDGERVDEREVVAEIVIDGTSRVFEIDGEPDFSGEAFEVEEHAMTSGRRGEVSSEEGSLGMGRYADDVADTSANVDDGGGAGDRAAGFLPALWSMMRGLGIGPRRETGDDEGTKRGRGR